MPSSCVCRQIWDTAGQEKYHSLAPMYYRGAGAAIVVYDITKMHSFRTLKEWVNELQAQGPQDITIAIAGNKRDLESERVSDSMFGVQPVSFFLFAFFLRVLSTVVFCGRGALWVRWRACTLL